MPRAARDRLPTPLALPEPDAARALWLQAFEQPQPSAPWTADDADWATREAGRQLGSDAAPAAFLALRARLGAERLAQRGQPLPAGAAAQGMPWRLLALVLGAVAGALVDAASAGGRINILALPLMGLLVWNLVVYGLLALQALRPHPPAGAGAAPTGHGLRATLQRLAAAARGRGVRARRQPGAPLRFAEAWARATWPLQRARITTALHLGALGFALGALASLYAHGLVFEYRAGWESTFLSADVVARLLHTLLGPASAWSGIALPDSPAAWGALRFPGGGENAARWIHLWALTVGALVLLPRALLALAAALQAHRLARRVPVGDERAWRRVRRQQGGPATPLQVLACNYTVSPERAAALQRWLDERHGPVALQWAPPMADSDDGAITPPALPQGAERVLLFTLTATPEAETHGALLRALPQAPADVVIDEADFRRRFPGAAGERRLAERRAAWQRLLADAGLPAPVFVDLGGVPATAEDAR